jgi:hypothetical protein
MLEDSSNQDHHRTEKEILTHCCGWRPHQKVTIQVETILHVQKNAAD